ncbi:hypothetical protein [Bacillus anthracis]
MGYNITINVWSMIFMLIFVASIFIYPVFPVVSIAGIIYSLVTGIKISKK